MNIKDDYILKDINEGYLVGGMVRDYFISDLTGKNIVSFDRDISIKNAENFAKELALKLDATFIILDNENKIYRLVMSDKKNYMDISELRGNSIEEDLRKRDFTINAIAYDLKNQTFIDVTNGIYDIKNKKLNSINEENFTDDPLRILRAFRFASTTGFELDDTLLAIITKYKNLITKPAKERIHDELLKLFGGDYAARTLIKMYDMAILSIIFPFVKDMAKVPPNSHHHLDLIHHSIETVNQIELQYKSLTNEECKYHLNSIDFGGYPRINHLKLAGFLHDIGKYSTWTVEQDGKTIWSIDDGLPYPTSLNLRHRFIKHDSVGAKMVLPILKELKFSNKQTEYISQMIKQHIYPSNVVSAPNLDNKIMMRYVRKMENNVIDNIILAKADRLSAQGPDITHEITENNINGLNKLLEFYLEVKPTLKPLPKLLDGNDVMQILGLKQSPELGKIMKALLESQISGDINTKTEAIEFVKKLALKHECNRSVIN